MMISSDGYCSEDKKEELCVLGYNALQPDES
jgi:hypothetical protein